MSSSHRVPQFTVPIPDKGVIFRKTNSNDIQYAYYAIRTYRNNKGQPTCERVCIGKKDPINNRLIPNEKYYDYFSEESKIEIGNTNDIFVKDFGNYEIVNQVCKDINLKTILDSSIGDYSNHLLSLAMYMLNEGSTINGCDIWFDKTKTFIDGVITSQRASEIFASISLQKRLDFFKLWRTAIKDTEVLAYDVTSFSSYTRNMNIFEYGYNRDNDNLPQINMALFYGESSQLPIFYNVYNGSITDKADLLNVMKYIELLNINPTRYIMDRGFYSKQNIKYFTQNNKRFLMAVENRLSYINELINKYKTIITNQENRIDKYDLYGIKTNYANKQNTNQSLDVYLFFSYERKENESKQQHKKIMKLEKQLLSLDTYNDESIKPYAKYFDIKLDNNKMIYQKNYQYINEENSNGGFFAFISNDESITIESVLDIYKSRGDIEQSFDGLKNSIDMKKLKTHTIQTTEGKIFTAFISLIIKSYLGKVLKDYNRRYEKMSTDERKNILNLNTYSPSLLLKEMSKVQITNIFGKSCLLKTLSKKQKDIFNLFNITEDKMSKDF